MKVFTTLVLSLILVSACGTANQSNLDASDSKNSVPGLCQYKHKKDTQGGKKGETNNFDFQRKMHSCDVKGDWKASCKDGNGDTDEVECKASGTSDLQKAGLKDYLSVERDGSVNLRDFKAFAASFQVSAPTAENYFLDADTDGNGLLSQTEFVLAYKDNVFPWAKSRVGA